jgi:hypothetical protein
VNLKWQAGPFASAFTYRLHCVDALYQQYRDDTPQQS